MRGLDELPSDERLKERLPSDERKEGELRYPSLKERDEPRLNDRLELSLGPREKERDDMLRDDESPPLHERPLPPRL
jgi:hypothetical protein